MYDDISTSWTVQSTVGRELELIVDAKLNANIQTARSESRAEENSFKEVKQYEADEFIDLSFSPCSG